MNIIEIFIQNPRFQIFQNQQKNIKTVLKIKNYTCEGIKINCEKLEIFNDLYRLFAQ